jgi:hypothetical protein
MGFRIDVAHGLLTVDLDVTPPGNIGP